MGTVINTYRRTASMVRGTCNPIVTEKGRKITFEILWKDKPPIDVRLVKPSNPVLELGVRTKRHGIRIAYDDTDREGLYLFNIVSGQTKRKRCVLVGDLIADWYTASMAIEQGKEGIVRHLDSFSQHGNLIVLHHLTGPEGVFYESRQFPIAENAEPALIDFFLSESARRGCTVLFSYHWVPDDYINMWRHPSPKQIFQAKRVIEELHQRYSRYDSMAGFYAYWEPGDVQDLPYYRETMDYVKRLDTGLFTACAPYVFSTERYQGGSLPLIFSALSSVRSLDCFIPQSSVAVFPYPLSRTKDHILLAAASSSGLGKIVLGHVETFGRSFVKGESAPPSSFIEAQILGASLTSGASGDAFFVYAYLLGRRPNENGSIERAMKFLKLTGPHRRKPIPVAVYSPLQASHWPNVLSPFLLRTRKLGLDLGVVQPPFSCDRKWKRWIKSNVKVLILPDPPELLESEAGFLAEYIKDGGELVVIGYPPSGIRKLMGIESRNIGRYGGLKLLRALGERVSIETVSRFGFELVFCATCVEAEPLAVYESIPSGYQPGAYAIARMQRGRGSGFFIGLPSALLLEKIPNILLDILDAALSRNDLRIPWEVRGLTDECDLMSKEDFLAAVNYAEKEIEATAIFRGAVGRRSLQLIGDAYPVRHSGEAIELRLLLRQCKPAGAVLVRQSGVDCPNAMECDELPDSVKPQDQSLATQ